MSVDDADGRSPGLFPFTSTLVSSLIDIALHTSKESIEATLTEGMADLAGALDDLERCTDTTRMSLETETYEALLAECQSYQEEYDRLTREAARARVKIEEVLSVSYVRGRWRLCKRVATWREKMMKLRRATLAARMRCMAQRRTYKRTKSGSWRGADCNYESPSGSATCTVISTDNVSTAACVGSKVNALEEVEWMARKY
ncbi:hypothetical protein EIP86_006620 [Pleurotus ostreatoroseus]|nr:hypothetical protein EIP86_006620 [Pleurotus ostreatoroseus]